MAPASFSATWYRQVSCVPVAAPQVAVSVESPTVSSSCGVPPLRLRFTFFVNVTARSMVSAMAYVLSLGASTTATEAISDGGTAISFTATDSPSDQVRPGLGHS